MNLPNSLTILRIFFIPVARRCPFDARPNVVFFGVPIIFAVWGGCTLLAAAATDWADGYYARRRREVTTLGILLDPHRGQAADVRGILSRSLKCIWCKAGWAVDHHWAGNCRSGSSQHRFRGRFHHSRSALKDEMVLQVMARLRRDPGGEAHDFPPAQACCCYGWCGERCRLGGSVF